MRRNDDDTLSLRILATQKREHIREFDSNLTGHKMSQQQNNGHSLRRLLMTMLFSRNKLEQQRRNSF